MVLLEHADFIRVVDHAESIPTQWSKVLFVLQVWRFCRFHFGKDPFMHTSEAAFKHILDCACMHISSAVFMHLYMYICVRWYIHTHVRCCLHAYIAFCIQAYVKCCIHACIWLFHVHLHLHWHTIWCTWPNIHVISCNTTVRINACIWSRAYAYIYIFICMCTRICIHMFVSSASLLLLPPFIHAILLPFSLNLDLRPRAAHRKAESGYTTSRELGRTSAQESWRIHRLSGELFL